MFFGWFFWPCRSMGCGILAKQISTCTILLQSLLIKLHASQDLGSILPKDAGSIPALRAKIPYDWGPKNQNKKEQQYCKKFNKDFKNSPHKKIFGKNKVICLSIANKCKVTLWHIVYSLSVTIIVITIHRGLTGYRHWARYVHTVPHWNLDYGSPFSSLRKHTHAKCCI